MPYLRLLTTLAACAAAAAPVRLTDPFDGTGTAKWMATNGDWSVHDGAYRAGGTGQSFLDSLSCSDVSLEVDCRITRPGPIPADWLGVIVGGDRRTGGTGHLIYLRWSGEVELYAGGRIIAAKMTAARARLQAGQLVRLAVAVAGKHFTVKVDGETCLDCDAGGYLGGHVGLASYDLGAEFDNLAVSAEGQGNAIFGQVLALPVCTPAPGARVEIYHSMDGYDSLVTRATVSGADGRFQFHDLPAGERAYWLRAGMDGYGGSTAWFVTVTPTEAAQVELFLVGAPRNDVWADSADALTAAGFATVPDPQCFGGSRLEVKAPRAAGQHPRWQAAFELDVPHDGSYTPHLAAGLYPAPHYWSDYWWSIDGSGPFLASRTLAIEGPRYGDRSTLVWARGPAQRLAKGKHRLTVILRDPAPHAPGADPLRYAWSIDAVALSAAPTLSAPVTGARVATARPTLRWQPCRGAGRYTVQLSQEPDFHNATLTFGGVAEPSFTPPAPLADGAWFWRVKALTAEETPFGSSFTAAERFVVATPAPAVTNLQVVSRGPHEAVLEWRTDVPCTSTLRYGLSGLGFSRSAGGPYAPSTHHRAELSGLEPMTHYYYAVSATDRNGQQATSPRRGFCTPRGVIGDRNSPFGIFGQGLTYAKPLSEAGARWYSDYWDWGTLEPSRGTFAWDQAEQRMARAKAAGVNLMVTFWCTPPWVRPSHPATATYGPDDPQDARDFFRAVAEHCRGRSNWWLPWIEPNVARDTTFGFPEGYWAGRPHARSYAAYQRAAYEGAKAGDPDCRVVGMNTAGVDLDFIGKCYDEGAADSFDVMNVHYYAMNAPFEQQLPEQMFADLRALMAEYGDAEKPIICSEGGGASSGLEGTSEETQADNFVRIFVLSIANGIDKLCWTFELDEKPYGSKRIDMIMWMGLFRFDPQAGPEHAAGEPKPSYYALRTMTGQLAGTTYAGPVALGKGLRAYRFERRGRRVTVAWAEAGEADASLPVLDHEPTLVDRRGAERTVTAAAGKLALHLSGSPLFVVEDQAAVGR